MKGAHPPVREKGRPWCPRACGLQGWLPASRVGAEVRLGCDEDGVGVVAVGNGPLDPGVGVLAGGPDAVDRAVVRGPRNNPTWRTTPACVASPRAHRRPTSRSCRGHRRAGSATASRCRSRTGCGRHCRRPPRSPCRRREARRRWRPRHGSRSPVAAGRGRPAARVRRRRSPWGSPRTPCRGRSARSRASGSRCRCSRWRSRRGRRRSRTPAASRRTARTRPACVASPRAHRRPTIRRLSRIRW